jgi:hypothetical protein
MLACCEIISTPLRLSVANIQFFVLNLHASYHELYAAVKTIKHHQKRVKMSSENSKEKARVDLQLELESFKKLYGGILDRYSDPYMEKVRVHYPDLYSALNQLKLKITLDKTIKDLLSTEL